MIVYRSPATTAYNCIAWAAEDTRRWWWPDAMDQYYWPPGVTREETVEAFIAAYGSLGYTPCATLDQEDGYQKIVVYVGCAGKPTHAAKQIPGGRWSGKLGSAEDVEHDTPEDVSALGTEPQFHYGAVAAILRRKVAR